MKNKTALPLTIAALALLSGCAPTVQVHGNMVKDYQIQQLSPGQDSVSDVLRKLGSPTTRSTFDDNIWYYMGQVTEKKGILDNKVTDERIIMLTFSDEGLLEKVENVNGDRLDLPYAKKETPTSGNEVTIMQQLLGNVGRFNPDVE